MVLLPGCDLLMRQRQRTLDEQYRQHMNLLLMQDEMERRLRDLERQRSQDEFERQLRDERTNGLGSTGFRRFYP
jgi:hypothetical protein